MNQRVPRGDGLHLKGLLLALVTVVMWAIGPLFVKHFTNYYDVWTQNAFRYGCAAIILLGATALTGRLFYPLRRGQWKKLIGVAAANLLLQTAYAGGYYFIYPSVASLVGRVNIVFVTVLSFLIYHDEREVIRSPRFLAGAGLALGGVIVVILGRDPDALSQLEVSNAAFWAGIACVVAFAFFVAVYSLAIKHAVRDIPPIVSFTHVSWMTAAGLAVPMLLTGGAADLWRGPAEPIVLMVVSAFLCIVVAHTCYYAALRTVKAVVTGSLLQLVPVITCVLSAVLYDDTLSRLQVLGGAAVITGAWLAALAQARRAEA